MSDVGQYYKSMRAERQKAAQQNRQSASDSLLDDMSFWEEIMAKYDRFSARLWLTVPTEIAGCQGCGGVIWDYELRNCPACGASVHQGCLGECEICGSQGCRACLVRNDETLEWRCAEECDGTEL